MLPGLAIDFSSGSEYTGLEGGTVVSCLALYLLGPPRIECDGVPIKLDRRKALALLAYLAVTGESHRRDSLVNLLWPEVDATRGRAALRRTLYALRKALTNVWLDIDREEIGLRSSEEPSISSGQTLWVDVDWFHRLLAECGTHGHPVSQVCPACLAPLTDAVALVHGDFLSGFGLKDSFNFDDWALFQAEVLRRELAEALERLVRWHSAQREFESALGYARHRLELDPLEEPAHRQLMRLFAWSGRRSAALRQYEECIAVLEDQLGVTPQDTTTQLYQDIQKGHPPPPPEARREQEALLPSERLLDLAAGSPPFLEQEMPAERPVFVARERELARLDGYLNAALSGQGRVVFVTGEAGSGKTTLVQEFSWHAQEAHADLIAASGNCNSYTGVGDPYLPFREILELLTGDVEAQWAAGAMTGEHARRLWNTLPLAAQALLDAGPDLIDTFVPRSALLDRAITFTQGPGGLDWLTHLHELVERRPFAPGMLSPQQSALFEQYSRVLQGLACQVPLVLLLDDLQWADVGSISLLFHLGRQLAGSRILIVGAYRPEEVAVGRDGARHPLEPVVNELQRDFGDITVNLGQAQNRDFIEAFLRSEPNRLGRAFREMLHRQTRGHPLFTIELLRGLQERGDLLKDAEGHWIEGPALDWERLPARVEAVIAERIGRLAQSLQATLRLASVEGEVFTAEVIARLLPADGRKVVGRLSGELDRRHRLVRAQAIERVASGRLSRYRFRNYLFQKYLYDSLDEVERAYLHEDVGSILEDLYGDQASQIAVQLAWHFQEAGIDEKARHYLRQAGERAVQLSAYQEAIAHLSRGLERLAALPDSGNEDDRLERAEQELALQLALAMAWQGTKGTQSPEVEKAYTRARELCQQTGKMTQLCQVVGGLSNMHYVRAEHHRARELAEEALSLAQQSGHALLEALAHTYLGFILFCLGEFPTARANFQQMISFYKPHQHHRALVFLRGSDHGLSALAYDACCLWCLGYPEQASQRSQEALVLARELSHPFSLADVICFAGCLFDELRRDPVALRSSSDELVRLANEKGMPTWIGMGTRCHGEALAMLGQIEEGMAQMRAGIAVDKSLDARIYQSGTLGFLSEAEARAGLPTDGLTTLDEALALVEETDERYCEAELYRLRGELLLAGGKDAEAEVSLRSATEVAQGQRAKSWELRATTSLARLWQKQGKQEEARKVLTEIYGWFTEGFDTADLGDAGALLEDLS
jgi:predicted ATPase/DNA-binding SARP family transcriptional activator